MLVDQVNPDKRVPHVILFYFNSILFIFYLITYKWDPCVIGWFRVSQKLVKSGKFGDNYPLATFGRLRFRVLVAQRICALYQLSLADCDLESGTDDIFSKAHLINLNSVRKVLLEANSRNR